MIKIAICDDNADLANSIENDIISFNDKALFCDVFQNGIELIDYLKSGQKPYNIYFMDISMPGQNGIETASILRNKDKEALIIFISDHKEYVYEVFEVLPFRFLRKLISTEVLLHVLSDAVDHLRDSGQIFFFHIGHDKYQLHYHEILYFEGMGRKVMIHSTKSTYEIYGKITDILIRLDQKIFCQTHASFIVNMNYIQSIINITITLQDGRKLPISKKHRNIIKAAHMSFIERRCGII